MTPIDSQSARLCSIQEDLQGLYDEARIGENAASMERYSKLIAGLTKQIKEQELHERETIKKAEALRMMQIVGTEFARLAKAEFGEDVIPVLAELSLALELLAEAELT